MDSIYHQICGLRSAKLAAVRLQVPPCRSICEKYVAGLRGGGGGGGAGPVLPPPPPSVLLPSACAAAASRARPGSGVERGPLISTSISPPPRTLPSVDVTALSHQTARTSTDGFGWGALSQESIARNIVVGAVAL
jgi:hypothetical protein